MPKTGQGGACLPEGESRTPPPSPRGSCLRSGPAREGQELPRGKEGVWEPPSARGPGRRSLLRRGVSLRASRLGRPGLPEEGVALPWTDQGAPFQEQSLSKGWDCSLFGQGVCGTPSRGADSLPGSVRGLPTRPGEARDSLKGVFGLPKGPDCPARARQGSASPKLGKGPEPSVHLTRATGRASGALGNNKGQQAMLGNKKGQQAGLVEGLATTRSKEQQAGLGNGKEGLPPHLATNSSSLLKVVFSNLN